MSNSKGQEVLPQHATKNGPSAVKQGLLYDPDVAVPTHAEKAKTLAFKMRTATLCTFSVDPEGYPYGSLVTYAMYQESPIFLISSLAEHTKNLISNSKSSLMIAKTGEDNSLAQERVTLLGECKKLPERKTAGAKHAFVKNHRDAAFYADFSDFSFYQLKVLEVRFIGGFGRMSWADEGQWLDAKPDPVAPYSQEIIDHMNTDHSDTMVLYCKAMSKATDTTKAVMTAVDRYGFEMTATTQQGQRPIRLGFDNKVTTADEVRKELVLKAKKARASLGL